MGIKDIFAGLFKPAADAYSAHAQAKAAEDLKQEDTKQQAQAQAVEVQLENLKADEAWEDNAQKNSGWKDELWTLGFFGVFIGSFLPVIQQYVVVGIAQMSEYPMWFRILFCSVVMASFGIRFWRR